MNVCTIIARNYVAHARVLARSFAEHHPGGTCTVLAVDEFAGYLDPAAEPFELIGIEEIGLPDPERMAAGYDVTEFSTAVKPWLLRHLLARDGVDSITYLDPDILVADSIERIAELVAAHEIVLTPHFNAPLPRDGHRPSEEDILIAGAYNLGFVSLAAGPTAERLLDWWSERLREQCVVDPCNGLFVDQRWIDLVPGFWPQLCILRDPEFNVAYWNLPTRKLERSGKGYLVDGRPLRFFHFSGFDPLRPEAFSKHQDRIEVAELPALRAICDDYAARLLRNGYEEARTWSYGWGSLPNGVRLDRPARLLYREAVARGDVEPAVFQPAGAERFLSHLREVPAGSGVSRYARALRDARPDLREAFPDVEGDDALAFRQWLREHAEPLGLPSELISANGSGPANPGVNLAGYLSSELGVGEAARQLGRALAARQLPSSEIDVPVQEPDLPAAIGGLGPEDHPFDVNLICVNADMLPAVAGAMPSEFFHRRHTAGLWFWEVERFPERWLDSFKYLDEVWVASEFVAEALRPVAPVPVSTVRIPVTPAEPSAERRAAALPEGFCFLYVFDFRSVFRRKNPLGAIEAFRRAFDPGEGASLLIKSVGGDRWPEEAAELAAAAAEHPDVHLLDGVISAEEKNALIAGCDCYVSLHRSEGLGLTMAEAMYFGKPVIATGYSGNLDFMSGENAYLVDYDLERIGDDAAPYPADARWAEPRIEHAAELMRGVFEDREGAARIGERAASAIRASHSPEAAGEVLERRLAELHRRRSVALEPAGSRATVPVRDYSDPGSGRALLDHLLRFEQPPPRPGSGRLRRFFKRAYLRALRPYAAHQRRIDLSIRESVDHLAFELAALERRLRALDGDGRGTSRTFSLVETGEALERGDEPSPTRSAVLVRLSHSHVRFGTFQRRLRALDGDVRGACSEQAEELAETRALLEALRNGSRETSAS